MNKKFIYFYGNQQSIISFTRIKNLIKNLHSLNCPLVPQNTRTCFSWPKKKSLRFSLAGVYCIVLSYGTWGSCLNKCYKCRPNSFPKQRGLKTDTSKSSNPPGLLLAKGTSGEGGSFFSTCSLCLVSRLSWQLSQLSTNRKRHWEQSRQLCINLV